MISDPTCTICGNEDEDGYHATMRCPKAAALRDNMRMVWELPGDRNLRKNGKEWTLNILNALNSEMRGVDLVACMASKKQLHLWRRKGRDTTLY
jgi:hypothetical protein